MLRVCIAEVRCGKLLTPVDRLRRRTGYKDVSLRKRLKVQRQVRRAMKDSLDWERRQRKRLFQQRDDAKIHATNQYSTSSQALPWPRLRKRRLRQQKVSGGLSADTCRNMISRRRSFTKLSRM